MRVLFSVYNRSCQHFGSCSLSCIRRTEAHGLAKYAKMLLNMLLGLKIYFGGFVFWEKAVAHILLDTSTHTKLFFLIIFFIQDKNSTIA